jgi:hypothetical protein
MYRVSVGGWRGAGVASIPTVEAIPPPFWCTLYNSGSEFPILGSDESRPTELPCQKRWCIYDLYGHCNYGVELDWYGLEICGTYFFNHDKCGEWKILIAAQFFFAFLSF